MRYRALQLGQPGRQPIPDEYEDYATLLCPASHRVILQVSSQSVYIQFGLMPQGIGSLGSVEWQWEEPFLPVLASLGRTFDAIRVRNLTAGQAGQIMVTVA